MVALPFCHFEKTTKKPLSKAYPSSLNTIGDHIRKRRLDLTLTQKQVAEKLGVDKATVWNWEIANTVPLSKHLPAIVSFLGYGPFEASGESLGERLLDYRKQSGLSQKKLAKAIGIDPSTLSRLEENNPRCFNKVVKMAADFLCRANPREDQ